MTEPEPLSTVAAPPIINPDPAQILDEFPRKFAQVQTEVAKAVVGQSATVDAALWALFSRGHCLLVGVPGLAKTLLVNALARSLDLPFSRIQFTPDLMPSDITGTEILGQDENGQRKFIFTHGPVFTNVLLADEINRTPPKTQAALLEAMQEKTVTVAGKLYRLAEPFIVLATQNPIEQEGTYPLPEAQLDRFLFEVPIDYPSFEDERDLVQQHSFTPLEHLKPVITTTEVLQFRDAIAHLPAAPNVVDYAVRLVRATRPGDAHSPEYIRRWVRWGASPRASQYLILAGRARAASQGRFNVACEDVRALAPLILRHRMIRSFQADAEGKTASDIITKLLEDIPTNE
ncbi:MAG TPA: MoxR family ATPase [Verrucomicrobiae bacterium]|jgi:MoxR-like ATPase|nr:MoxR family ATPase [Verrucomicrobiae bacterium]